MMVIIGAVFGSFLTCLLYRVPRHQSMWTPPSSCPVCGTCLKAVDLIPVLSWVMFRGRCRHCGKPMAKRYVLIELLSIFLAVGCFTFLPIGFGALFFYGFVLFSGVFCYFWWKCGIYAVKSVAFGFLCLGVYLLSQQPVFACSAAFY